METNAMPEELLQGEDSLEGVDEGDLDISGQKPSISLPKNDRSLSELHRWYEKGRLIVDPEWQRQYVWETKRAAQLIESFLIDLPIPVILGTYILDCGMEVLSDFPRNSCHIWQPHTYRQSRVIDGLHLT